MAPCRGGVDATSSAPCQFHPGTKATYNEETELYEGHETGGSSWGGHDGAYGAPFYDSVDLEWSKEWVSSQPTDLKNLILSGKIRMGRDTTHLEGGVDLTLPLPGSKPDYDPATDHLEYLKMLQGSGTAGEAPAFWSVDVTPPSGVTSTMTFTFNEALRSGGFPMCPNYWDAHGGDEPGPLNLATGAKELSQDGSFYKFPNQVVGSPLIGDPELAFCRKWQEKYDATCCATYLDEDIQEEYEELTGSGYLGAHVFVQQYLCLPCHPMVSCMIDESTSTLRIPLVFLRSWHRRWKTLTGRV
jgi:hypothetical protein